MNAEGCTTVSSGGVQSEMSLLYAICDRSRVQHRLKADANPAALAPVV